MKIFIDFDNTIVDSTKAFVAYYNLKNGTVLSSNDIVDYNFNNAVKMSQKEISNVFSTKLFYSLLETYKDVVDCLYILKRELGCELYLISNCTDKSVCHKIKWLTKNNMDKLFDGKIFLSINKAYDKSVVDMRDSILIDDHRENHLNSNAKYKFAYKDLPSRNWFPTKEDGVIVKDSWKAIAEEIRKIVCQNKTK